MNILRLLATSGMALALVISLPGGAANATSEDASDMRATLESSLPEGRTLEDFGVVEVYEDKFITLDDGTVLPHVGHIDPDKGVQLSEEEYRLGPDGEPFKQDENPIEVQRIINCDGSLGNPNYLWIRTVDNICFASPGASNVGSDIFVSSACVLDSPAVNYQGRTEFMALTGVRWTPWHRGCWTFEGGSARAYSAEVTQTVN